MARKTWTSLTRGVERGARATFRVLRRPAVWIPLLFIAAVGIGLAWGAWKNLCANCPSVAQIHTWEPEQTSKVFDRHGTLIAEIGSEARTLTSIESLPPHVPQAFIAVEDRRFYGHGGVDVRGLSRAVFGVLTTFSLSGAGGSTITQQLARNMFIQSIGFDRSVARKIRELQVAFELERAYTKDQILEAYMNQINLGLGIWGIHTASRHFFGKTPQELDPAEAATLAALAKNPRGFSPFVNPDRSKSRRDLVLDLMARERFVTREEARRWKETPLPESRGEMTEDVGGYFVQMVRDEAMARWPGQVNIAGLHIYTTLDLDIQRAAERAMASGFDRVENYPGFNHPKYADFAEQGGGLPETNSPYVQGALLSLDPSTGAIRAMIGGRDINHSKFNRVTQASRQAGSSFKTIVYASALASGIPASRIITDGPVVRQQVDGTEWRPQNFDRTFLGDMTLRHAFQSSINTVAIKLADEELSIETVAQTARRLGITTEIPRVPSIAIGAADVLMIQMAEAYSAIVNDGNRLSPHAIVRVESPDGAVLWEPSYAPTRVLEPEVARLMVSLLEQAANSGTGARLRADLPYEVPAAGKTGTTNDNTDVWFIGATPDLQTTVWFGMDRPARIANNATGGVLAAPVFGEFMRYVYYGYGEDNGGGETGLLPIPEPWSREGLISREVDRQTGLLASQWCPSERSYVEWYIPGTEPSAVCDESTRSRFPSRWW